MSGPCFRDLSYSSQTSARAPTLRPLSSSGGSSLLGTWGEGFESSQASRLCTSPTSLEEVLPMAGDLESSGVQVENVLGFSVAGGVRDTQRQSLGLPFLSEWPSGLLSSSTLSQQNLKQTHQTIPTIFVWGELTQLGSVGPR